jgi:hypothetical protein
MFEVEVDNFTTVKRAVKYGKWHKLVLDVEDTRPQEVRPPCSVLLIQYNKEGKKNDVRNLSARSEEFRNYISGAALWRYEKILKPLLTLTPSPEIESRAILRRLAVDKHQNRVSKNPFSLLATRINYRRFFFDEEDHLEGLWFKPTKQL